jgi:hypothetical protein
MPGHKTYNIGDEVLAADFNPYVMDQVVTVWASAAARTAGWATPPNGAQSYLQDHPGALYCYNGTAWIQVQAGTEVGFKNQASDIGLPGTLSDLNIGIPDVTGIANRIYRVQATYQINYIAAANINVQLRQGAPSAPAGTHANILQRSVDQRTAGTFATYEFSGRYIAGVTGPFGLSLWASTTAGANMVQGGSAFTQIRTFDCGTT